MTLSAVTTVTAPATTSAVVARIACMAAAATLAVVLTGCGEASHTAAERLMGGPKAKLAPAASAADQELERQTQGMVSAVTLGRLNSDAIALKFALQARPEVGQPLKVDLAFLPQVASESLSASFIPVAGLTISPDQAPAQFANVQPATAYRYTLSVVPDASGVFYLSTVAHLDTASGPAVHTFSIPVLVE